MSAAKSTRVFVQRLKLDDPQSDIPFGKIGFVGPFRSERRAEREVEAWLSTGTWFAAVVDASPSVSAQVRSWERRS